MSCTIGAGSANPVASKRIRRNGGSSPRSRLTRSVRSGSSRSLRIVQQIQPLASTATSPSTRSTRRWSRLTSPYSLIMTALSRIASWRSTRLSSVVLPLPRKPVINDTGSRWADLSFSNRLIGALTSIVLFLSLDSSLAEEEHAENNCLSPESGHNLGGRDERRSQRRRAERRDGGN